MDLLNRFVGDNRELDAYLKLIKIRAENFVACDRWWKAIRAVAKALREHDRLTADEVWEITHQLPPGSIKTAKAQAKEEL